MQADGLRPPRSRWRRHGYRYVVHDSKSYHAFFSYRTSTQNRWRRNTSLRFGVNNLFNTPPSLSSAANGYDAAVSNSLARGRAYSLTLTKKL